ncbi:MAG: condensation domain-containing protein, partial [Psychrosphaera sp.]|nr:condensation domain-containing protein [Psychrosphaera sp.]
ADTADLHHFNQSVLLTTPKDFDETALNTLVKQLYQRHDALRMQFMLVQGQWRGRYPATTDDQLDDLVTSAIAVKTWQGDKSTGEYSDIESYADEIQCSLNLAQGRLFRAVYIKSEQPNSAGRLLLVIHHLVIDGVSWRILLEDLESLYRGHQALAPKTSSYQQWGSYLAEYANSAALNQQRDYWLAGFEQQVDLLCDLPANRPVNQPALILATAAEPMAEVDFSLDKTLTTQLLTQSNQAYRSQINELLLSAVLLGIYRWGGTRSIRLDLEGHGREALTDTIDLSQTVGWFTTVYPLTLSFANDSLAELIGRVKDSYRAIPDNGIGFGVLKSLCNDDAFAALPASELVFNYLGQFDQVVNDDTCFGSAPESRGEEVSPARKATHALALNGMVIAEQLRFTLSYAPSHYDADAMQKLMDTIAQALKDVVQHCV